MEQLKFNLGDNFERRTLSEEEKEWMAITRYEKIKKIPQFVGLDFNQNFRVNFEVINRHGVLLTLSFIFDKQYPETKRVRSQITSAEGPLGVNIHNDFRTYTYLSQKCFLYLKRRAIAIYNSHHSQKEKSSDQYSLDLE
jgi:hypothetical protein